MNTIPFFMRNKEENQISRKRDVYLTESNFKISANVVIRLGQPAVKRVK